MPRLRYTVEEITLVCEVEISLSEREPISIARDSLPLGYLDNHAFQCRVER
jgi:hypothetical protein